MRAVPVPAGMKERILAKLAEERAVRRRWLRRAARAAALAAALLLVVWGGYEFVYVKKYKEVHADKVYQEVTLRRPFDHDQVNDAVARLDGPLPAFGTPSIAPDFCNYEYLVGEPALAKLPGYADQQVPQLVFVRPSADLPKQESARKAIVYVIKKGHKDKVIGPSAGVNDDGYQYKIDVRLAKHDPTLAYVVLYDGDNYDWLLVNKRSY
jgi:hypothetical protein